MVEVNKRCCIVVVCVCGGGGVTMWTPQKMPQEQQTWYIAARAVLKGPDFLLLRTALKERPKGPPTANRQLPPTANRHQPPTANRQPRPTANRQPLPTATNHPSSQNGASISLCSC